MYRVVFIIVIFCTMLHAANEIEPNDRCWQRDIIDLDTTMNASLHDRNDQKDYFGFSTDNSDENFKITLSANRDVKVTLARNWCDSNVIESYTGTSKEFLLTEQNRNFYITVESAVSGRVDYTIQLEKVRKNFLVDDDKVQCPDANYNQIQDAINNASFGDTIEICQGTYSENIVINKDGLVIKSQSGNKNDVLINGGSSDPIIEINGVDTLQVESLRVEQNQNKDAIQVNSYSKNITLNDLNITSTRNDGIELNDANENLEFSNLFIIASDEGIDIGGNINQGLTVSNVAISASDIGIKVDGQISGGVSISDTNITSIDDALSFGGTISGQLSITNSKINSSSEKGIEFYRNISNVASFSNLVIDSNKEGIEVVGNLSTASVWSQLDINSTNNDAIEFRGNISSGLTLSDSNLTGKLRGIDFQNSVNGVVLDRVKVISKEDYGIYSATNAWIGFTLRNSCITSQSNNDYALRLRTNRASGVTVTNNCFYANSTAYLGRMEASTGTFNANYWDKVSGSYTQNNISDTSTLNSCTNSCATENSFKNPLIEYRFDECEWDGTTNEVIDSAGERNATSNGVDIIDDSVINNAANFNGSSTIEIGDISELRETASLSFWIKTTQVGSDTTWRAPGLIGVEQSGGNDDIIWGFIDSDGRIGIDVGTTSNSNVKSTTLINDGVYHHIVLTRDSLNGEVKVYINGSLENTGSLKTGIIGETFTQLGKIKNSNYLTGLVDEVKIFDSILTDGQVENIYNSDKNKKTLDGNERETLSCPAPEPITDYHFDECSWSGVADEVKDDLNNYHAIAYGSATTSEFEKVLTRAADFTANSDSDYVVLDNAILHNKTDFSIAVWIKSSATEDQTLISGANSSQSNELIFFIQNSGTGFSPFLKGSSHSITIPDITDDTWHHLVWTRDTSSGVNCLIIDGDVTNKYCTNHSENAALNIEGLILAQEQDSVLGGFVSHQDFEGYMDEMKIYDKVLLDRDITTIYQHEIGGRTHTGEEEKTVFCSTNSCSNYAPQLSISTYDLSAYGDNHMNNHTEFNTAISTYKNDTHQYGSGLISEINTQGSDNNPFGSSEKYLTIIDGYINVTQEGNYTFVVNGDDAVEVLINDNVVSSWYGGHNAANDPTNNNDISRRTINLNVGYHKIEFRHHENAGSDSYELYWSTPANNTYSIVPANNLFHCIPNPPLVEYRFDECDNYSGVADEVKDSSGNEYSATISSNVENNANGVLYKSASFSGIPGYITDEDAENYLNGLSEITVSTWVKSNVVATDNGIFSGVSIGGSDSDFGLRYDKQGNSSGGSNLIKASISTTAGRIQIETESNVQSTQWSHIAYTWKSGESIKIYLNGELLNNTYESSAVSGVISNIDFLHIGHGAKGGYWDGQIDEFKIFSTALKDSQIKEVYNNEVADKNYDGMIREELKCECNIDTSESLATLEFEGGQLKLLNTLNGNGWTQVDFNKSFSKPPVVFALLNSVGENPAQVYIKDVTTTGFKAIIAEPQGMDGPHLDQDINFLAISKGLHKIGENYFEVGTIDTMKYQQAQINNEWTKLTTKISGCSNPAIVVNKQTVNNESGLDVNPRNDGRVAVSKPFLSAIAETNSTGFYVSLEMSETTLGSISQNETIAYMIGKPGIQDSFVDDNGNTINFETIRKDLYFEGWSDSCNEVSFVNDYNQNPLIAASKVGRIGDNGGWARSCSLNKDKIGLKIDEDTAMDSERSHSPEDASIFVFSENFVVREFQTCFVDNFDRTSLGDKWRIIKSDKFTPTITDTHKMILTNNSANISTGVTLAGEFPSENNLIEIEFEHNAYGSSNGADGVAVVLSDGNVTSVAGGFGGSLGYAPKNNVAGFTGAWLGFGIDEYGNFARDGDGNKGRGCSTPYTNNTRVQDSITIRGRGESNSYGGYCFIANSGQLTPGIDATTAQNHKYKFTIDTRTAQTKITVQRDTGSGYVIVPNMDEINATQSATAPSSFKLSLTASTGGNNNYHSFDDIKIKALSCGTVGQDENITRSIFDAWNTTTDFTNRFISTKIVGQNFDITVGSLNDNSSATEIYNGTVCSQIVDDVNTSLSSWQKLFFTNEETKTVTFADVSRVNKNSRVLLTWKAGEDVNCPIASEDNRTLSTDNFAIRPDRFEMNIPSIAYAGENFAINFRADDDSSNSANNYNETLDSSFEVNASITNPLCTGGTFNVANFSFIDGLASSVDANFTDVGDLNITIQERLGSEFALVDSADTTEQERLITPLTRQIVVQPYELNITNPSTSTSTGNNWLYMADVNDMSFQVNATLRANDINHNLVQNFRDGCYAKDVQLRYDFSVNNDNTGVELSYLTNNISLDNGSKLLTDINKTATISSTDFTTSSVDFFLLLNIDRVYNTPYNPITIALQDIVILTSNEAKVENNAATQILPSMSSDFYFGRLKTQDLATNVQNVEHKSEVEVFCDNCSGLNGFHQSSLNWYLQENDDNTTTLNSVDFHPREGFAGNSTRVTEVSISNIQGITDGIIRFDVDNSFNSTDEAMIHLNTPEWLWYSRYNQYDENTSSSDCSTHYCFGYRYNLADSGKNIQSGTYKGTTIGEDFNLTRERKGIKTFR